MTLWQGILLGLVQGLAEFLPVSSSGHLRVLEVVTGVRAPGVFVEVPVHVGALAAVLVVSGRRLVELLGGAIRGRPAELRMVGLLAIATVPAGVVGGLFHHQVEEAATPLGFIGAGFIVPGFMNWSTGGRGGGAPSPILAWLGRPASVLRRRWRPSCAAFPDRDRRCAQDCGAD